MFGIAKEKVRIIVPYVGGAYGNKNHTKFEPLATALSRKTRRPVFLSLSTEDTFRTVSKPAMRVRIKTGVSQGWRSNCARVRRSCRWRGLF